MAGHCTMNSIMAGRYNFTVEQNTVIRRTFTWSDEDDNAIDLSGSTVVMTAKPYKRPSINLTPYCTLQASLGRVVLEVPADVTDEWDFSSCSYDLLVQGVDDRLLQGVITISRGQS